MYSAQGIILKREDFREKDERVVLYTKEFGKISVIAKGAKRIEAKLRGSLDIFNFVDIIFVEGRHFFILTGVEIQERFSNLIKNPYGYSAVFSMSNSLLHIFEENSRDEDFFDFVYGAVKKLDEFDPNSSLHPWLLLKKFQLKVLENQGYKIDEKILSSLNIKKPSSNAAIFFGMLQGSDRADVCLSKKDFSDIEGTFMDIFSYIFNYRVAQWIPVIQ